ncbi:MAG: hypothetical protein M1136_09680 [Chloroflexi bacterium]|nr:hypothetical protein [Chloroflexota bacterium]MCL5075898.1 hypothetical protein [Chloroflexota bacterium]
MNLFNRIVVVILLLLLIVLALGTALAPAPLATIIAEQCLAAAQLAARLTVFGQIILAVLALAITAVCLFLLFLELRRERPTTVVLAQVSGSQAEITLDSVAQRLKHEIESVAGVRQATPFVTSKRRSVDVRLVVLTEPDGDVPALAGQISQLGRDTVGKMGVRLGKLQAQFKHAAYTPGSPTT